MPSAHASSKRQHRTAWPTPSLHECVFFLFEAKINRSDFHLLYVDAIRKGGSPAGPATPASNNNNMPNVARRFHCDPIHRYINKSGSSTLVDLIRLLGAAVPAAVAAVVAAAVFDLPRFAASDYRVTPAIGRVVRH